MDKSQFDWNIANLTHIAEHDVASEETEEVLINDPLEMGFETTAEGEDHWTYVGETLQGRILQVIITLRNEKIRVVTAFEPIRRIKLQYFQFKAGQS